MIIFLDDERFPVNDGKPWLICRSKSDVLELLEATNRVIEFISFDHDLSDPAHDQTGFAIAKDLIEKDLDNPYSVLSQSFSFYVHSQNPIGKANIEALLNNYLKVREYDHSTNRDIPRQSASY